MVGAIPGSAFDWRLLIDCGARGAGRHAARRKRSDQVDQAGQKGSISDEVQEIGRYSYGQRKMIKAQPIEFSPVEGERQKVTELGVAETQTFEDGLGRSRVFDILCILGGRLQIGFPKSHLFKRSLKSAVALTDKVPS